MIRNTAEQLRAMAATRRREADELEALADQLEQPAKRQPRQSKRKAAEQDFIQRHTYYGTRS